MSERWIVGTDGSDQSLAALRWAVRQSSGRQVRIESVHAESSTVGDRLMRAVRRLWRRGAHEPDGYRADRDVLDVSADGPAGPALVRAASGAALLVTGRHGAGGGWRNALGSVSRYCVTHATTPTVVVPPGVSDVPVGRIVVGFDGSANSRAALAWALHFAGAGVDVSALIAIEIAPWLQEDIVHVRLSDELEAERERLLGLLAAADPDGRARPDVVVRGAKPALARSAESADLVVVGARGTGLLSGMGSVSTWLLEASPCPIAVVPHPAGN
ncbi:MAG: universal stress protein [Ilumatobacteraceae bacterium]|nr:universal stress protein [Ilumatobacteraceae bacterium]